MLTQPGGMAPAESSVGLSGMPKITIVNPRTQAIQRRFALAAITVPFIGSLVAIWLAWHSGVGLLEIGLLLGMYTLTVVGVTVGFHRLFAHRAFEAKRSVRIALGILGSMAAQGTLIYWAATHRRHHQYAEQPEDPHSPYIHEGEQLGWLRGLWHSHIGWMLDSKMTNSGLFARDLLQDPDIVRINQLYLVWVTLGLAIPAVLGGIVTGQWIGVLQGFLWGGLVRIFLAHHFMWTSGSTAHMYGSRPFETRDRSTNNIWLAIPNFGEAWHNNHHAFPNSAMFGLEWWQPDFGGWVIRTLEQARLVSAVKVPTREMIEAKKRPT